MSTVEGSGGFIRDGLIFHLDTANSKTFTSNVDLFEISGYGLTGSLLNGATISNSNYGSILFDGSNDLVEFGSISGLTQFTISIWFKITGPGTTGAPNTIYNTLFGINSGKRILVANSDNPSIEGRILVQMGGSNYFSDASSSGITIPNRWNNVVYTFTSNTARLYINGVAQTSQSNSSVTFPQNQIYLGAYNKPITAYAMKGYISQTLIYNRALSLTEVLKNYNSLRPRFSY
jgi:hypothetical protein